MCVSALIISRDLPKEDLSMAVKLGIPLAHLSYNRLLQTALCTDHCTAAAVKTSAVIPLQQGNFILDV